MWEVPFQFSLTEMGRKLSYMQEARMQIIAALWQVSLGFLKSFYICCVNNFTYNLTKSAVQKRYVSCSLQMYWGEGLQRDIVKVKILLKITLVAIRRSDYYIILKF